MFDLARRFFARRHPARSWREQSERDARIPLFGDVELERKLIVALAQSLPLRSRTKTLTGLPRVR